MKDIRAAVVAIFLFTMLLLGLCLSVKPAKAAPAPPVPSITWGPPPARERIIEVVDKVKPASWRVGAAVSWLDRYTASDMRLVSRCSGKAYRCVTVRGGTVKGGPVGWSSGSTVVIDTNKARYGKYARWYRADKHRTWLLIHELGHQHGLKHGTGRHVMNPYVNRYKRVLTTGQKKALRSR